MELKHTPGPLFVSGTPMRSLAAIQHYNGAWHLNVVTGRSQIIAKLMHPDKETLMANAKLFAAAPVMLDMLIEVVKNIEASDTECWAGFDVNKIQSLIDKATK